MTHNIQYNTAKAKLRMPEYGRTIQEMVNHCMQIENRQERLLCAKQIVANMASLTKEKVTNPAVQTKLWNHLALISGFALDIDYPVEIIPQNEMQAHPTPMSLPHGKIRQRHYGRIVEKAIAHLGQLPAGEERTALVKQTADRMRQNLFTWNPDSMSAEKIAADLDSYAPQQELSKDLQGHRFASLHTLPTNVFKKKGAHRR